MRRIACLLFLAVISASALSCASTRSSPNRMKADAAAVDRRFQEAFNKGDLDGIMACYWKSPDVVMHPPDARWPKAGARFGRASRG
jgi:ketosteroid isomerase-like protein